jgi:hypothetical protein
LGELPKFQKKNSIFQGHYMMKSIGTKKNIYLFIMVFEGVIGGGEGR